jgi:hypothetical protein
VVSVVGIRICGIGTWFAFGPEARQPIQGGHVMLLFGLSVLWESETLALREDLLECIETQIQGQVQDLDLDCQGDLVVVTGGCESLAIKQLVTRAIRAAEPQVRLQNEIRICA